jgi:hypothetical protein
MAVSPFDGANRIRFKGSPECGFMIAALRTQIRIQHSEIRIPSGLSAARFQCRGSPENFVTTVYYIFVKSLT